MRVPFAVAFLIVASALLVFLPEHMSMLLFRMVIVLLAATGVLLAGSFAAQEGLVGQVRAGVSDWRNRHAFQPGQIGRHLVHDVKAGKRNRLEELLREALPPWPITVALLAAGHELLELRSAAVIAGRVGVPQAITEHLCQEAERAALAVGKIADRVAAVGAQHVEHPRLHDTLNREAARVEAFSHAIRQAREALAELTAAGNSDHDLEAAEAALRVLREMTQDELGALEQS
jgi:hypothetical protein